MSIVVFIYWVLDVPATFLTGFDRGGILEMRMRTIAQNYLKGQMLRCGMEEWSKPVANQAEF